MLVLASNSPRRKQLLALGGWKFTIIPAEIDEQPLPGEAPKDYVLRLAKDKAQAAANQAVSGSVILAADTTVVDGSDILGKPASPTEAVSMLRRLRAGTHQVYTALSVLRIQDYRQISEVCATDVTMRDYGDDEIDAYVGSGDPMDKAGAYAIQHAVFNPVKSLQGCFTNVMGLPLCRVNQILGSLGVFSGERLPYPCLYTVQKDCSFSLNLLE